ncbi:hypothetical protein GSI_00178 [Ganoderma sinense ZZ0214-1]|uniref:Transcription factor n=1 Tax=Ganoderma sinense ZZ0214-1 TaxID=1077348 RepID=A0A2G8SRU3_9APHY|nr:hypothetical protein GSI_00178 [Ganoderma sinense ZZ0214-1]
MPPRLNKRQLREQEELQALQDPANDAPSEDQSEPESPVAPAKPPLVGFAALVGDRDHDDDESVEEKEEEEGESQARASKSKKKKKKKKTVNISASTSSPLPEGRSPEPPHDVNDSVPSTPAGPSKKERKALKKQKAKQKQKEEEELDDVDKALAELSVKYPDLKPQLTSSSGPASSPATARSLATLLSVSVQHLDSEAELRKFFGSRVISAAKGSSSSASTRQSVATRSNLTRPQASWWPAQFREGLSVRQLTDEEVSEGLRRHLRQPLHGEKVWTVEYSKKYRAVTFDFMRTVLSGDPEGFWQVLRILPYHADTLLQLSEVSHHREEHSTAADYVDRSLFTYERAFFGAFNYTSGANRLDFDHVENRPFFLALHRQITDLQRRGCVRTSFEFARLLYALDPWTDPHGSLLHLDYLAIKTGMIQWLIELWDLFEPELAKETTDSKSPYMRRIVPNVLPGFAYARALALFIREERTDDRLHEESTPALEDAIRRFPSVVPVLADKADISLSASIRSHAAFRIHTDSSMLLSDSHAILHLLSHLYAQRSASFWKSSARSAWFAKAVSAVLPSLPKSSPAPPKAFSARFDSPSLAYSIYRHVLVNEATCRSLFPFLPRAVLDARHLACDPLPPPTRANEYDAEFFRGVEDVLAARPRSRRQEARLLERLVPDAAFRAQLAGFWEAHPVIQQRFPGGSCTARRGDAGGLPDGEFMVDFVDPEDDEDDVEDHPQAAAVPVRPAVQARDAVQDEDGEEDDEDDDEEEEIAPLPVRFLRSVINRFWGGGNAGNEDDSDEEQNQLRDTGGVD